MPESTPTTTRLDLTGAALACLAAAAVAVAIRVSEPFAHGDWLVAYLALVGFLAQLLLGRGQVALLPAHDLPPPPRDVRLAQALFWNLGVVAVPVGVLAEIRLAVVVGSLSLLAALASLWKTARPALVGAIAHRDQQAMSYAAHLMVMTVSVFIGSSLAWDIPWA